MSLFQICISQNYQWSLNSSNLTKVKYSIYTGKQDIKECAKNKKIRYQKMCEE